MLIPEENVKDLADIPDIVKNKLEIEPVKWIDRVLELALERAPQPIDEDVANVAQAKAKKPAAGAAPGEVVAH